MKAVVVLVCLGIALLAFTGRLSFDAFPSAAPDVKSPIGGVNDLIEQAVQAGQPAKPGTPAAKLDNQCAYRERRLSAVPRRPGLRNVHLQTVRILAILKAHSRRAAEPPEVLMLDLEQQRIVQQLADAAARGNAQAAQTEAIALRELAGRANATFLRLGLTHCVMRGTSMPL